MDVQQILRPLQQFEEKLGELYDWFADVHRADAEVASVLARLALDERSHAGQVEYMRRLVRQNPRSFGDVELDLAEVYAGIDRIQKLRANLAPPTAAEVVRIALELESSAADFHFRAAIAKLEPGMARLVGSLGRADRAHYETLLDLAERRDLIGPDTPVPAPRDEPGPKG
jgi:rubrerythrin